MADVVSLRTEEELPRIINGYTLLEILGSGGQATAYRASKGENIYCVREHPLRSANDWEAIEQVCKREFEVLQNLNHPRIPSSHEIFEGVGSQTRMSLYAVQDLMPGVCLKKKLEEIGKFDEERVVDLGLQVCEVLSYLHGQTVPVVHRDLKPSNLLLNETDEGDSVSVVDFGAVQQRIIRETVGSTVFGTRGYVAPEQALGNAIPRSDLYSLGVTFLALCSGLDIEESVDEGIIPFDMRTGLGYKSMFRFDNPSLEVVVDKMLEVHEDQRIQTVEQVADYLEKIKAGKSISRPKERTGRFLQVLASFVPNKLLRYLVRSRKSVVEDAQRDRLLVSATESVPSSGIEVASGEGHIEQTQTHMVYHNVPHRNKDGAIEPHVFKLTQELLFGGEALGQEQYVDRLQGMEECLPTVIEYLSILHYLEQNKNHPDGSQKELFQKEQARLKELFHKYWLMTGTKTEAFANSYDGQVIHGVGREEPLIWTVEAPRLVGDDEYILRLKDQRAVAAIGGTEDIHYINEGFKSVSGKDSYFYRLNSKSSDMRERPVVLGLFDYVNRFSIYAYNDVVRRALGVVTQRARDFQ